MPVSHKTTSYKPTSYKFTYYKICELELFPIKRQFLLQMKQMQKQIDILKLEISRCSEQLQVISLQERLLCMENAFAPMVVNVNQHSAMLATNLSKSVVTESTSVKYVTQTVICDHF